MSWKNWLKFIKKQFQKQQKPIAYNGFDRKYQAKKKTLENISAYLAHLKSLLPTNLQPHEDSEIYGDFKTFQMLCIVYVALYLDMFALLCHISVSMQQEIRDPVKVIKSIKEFTWTTSKLAIIIDEALSSDSILTNYKSFRKCCLLLEKMKSIIIKM